MIIRPGTPRTDALLGIRCAVESIFLYLADNPKEARILIVESSGLSTRVERVRRDILRQHAGQVCHKLVSDPLRSPISAR